MLPVADAHPWPEKQRSISWSARASSKGTSSLKLQWTMGERPLTYLSEQHQEAVRALRALSGQDAGPNPTAWRRVLGQN